MEKAKKLTKKMLPTLRTAGLTLVALFFIVLFYHLLFWQRIYPGVKVSEIYLGGKTTHQAQQILEGIAPPETIAFVQSENKFFLKASKVSLAYNVRQSVQNAFLVGRGESFQENTRAKFNGLVKDINLPLVVSYDENRLQSFLQDIAGRLFIPGTRPAAKIQGGKVIVDPGKIGQEVEPELLENQTREALIWARNEVEIPLKITTPLTSQEAEELRSRAENLLGTSIVFSLDGEKVTLRDSQLVGFLQAGGKISNEELKIAVDHLTQQFSRPLQNPIFRLEGNRVTEFKPARDGISVDKEKLEQIITVALIELERGKKELEITIPATRTKPTLTTEKVNNLGIRELLGRGTSSFKGSIPSRVYNIALAASRLNGVLIPPGEVFSFNEALGDVSGFTGYKQAYVIREGRTILGDGGGVCQVSTTFFRAALAAGLPIIERRAHSYRVSYYEQDSGPGLDATVYAPSTDLKIKNDTPAHILIQAIADTQNLTLTFEFYGTKDGRVATISKPRVWDIAAPPPDLYQDDPTLPLGKIKQIDFKAWGAKAAFDYQVRRGNEILQDRTFYSIFRPWQAIYLRGTGPR